ncbi:hypothetical protein E2562_038126 [Oryza meyeriana var. granulata]|uniref:DUF7477 domain-containing protein n=1 Tax=Oryza meyeriana var. granulata TaxID=110450 RepID=A0A6G1F289_9ORYZ|nr:hypothetical protein E2562_038126 [Oryza meyeriana var. granulata]
MDKTLARGQIRLWRCIQIWCQSCSGYGCTSSGGDGASRAAAVGENKSFLAGQKRGRLLVNLEEDEQPKKKGVELDFLYPSEGIHRRWENGC